MIYNVTKKYESGSEQPCERFEKLDQAKSYALECAEKDASVRVKVIYSIYEFDEVVETVDSTKITIRHDSKESDESSSSSKGQGAAFRPTPLETSPRPKGTAPRWIHDDDKNDKDDKSED